MENSIFQISKPNEFVIPNELPYTGVDPLIWEVIEFLMTKLEPVHLEDLDIDNRECAICQLEFCVSEDAKKSRPPVKTICGHIFCQKCIIKWLNPLQYEDLAEDADSFSPGTDRDYDEDSTEDVNSSGSRAHSDDDEDSTEYTNTSISGTDSDYYEEMNTSCPMCRNAFFSEEMFKEPIEVLAAHLWFWDNAYAFAGVTRSEKEEYCRYYLWKYLNFCRLNYTFEIDYNLELDSLRCAQLDVLNSAKELKNQSLTPVQEGLRKSFEKLGEDDLADIILNAGKSSQPFYVLDPRSLI